MLKKIKNMSKFCLLEIKNKIWFFFKNDDLFYMNKNQNSLIW
jgi:hypothetical protein